MRILLTNDDGIYAPGLRALRRVAANRRGGRRGTSYRTKLRRGARLPFMLRC
ncbi:MAG: 5'/3'-nucleotidase SurE [Gemmataceae bacterium]